jgi:hypothetical protein
MFSDDEYLSLRVMKNWMKTSGEGGCLEQNKETLGLSTRRMLV